MYFHPLQIEQLLLHVKEFDQPLTFATLLKKKFYEDGQELMSLDRLLSQLDSQEKAAFQILYPYFQPDSKIQLSSAIIRNSIYLAWIEKAERANPHLMEVSERAWSMIRDDYAAKLKARRKKVTELINRRLQESLIDIITYNRLKNPVTFRGILHQVTKKKQIWPLRKLISTYWYEGLSKLLPCWMASPETVAAVFPMDESFFDLVIFDEASQCYVERGLPAMLRAKQCVIAGDPQQLQPLNLYSVRYEEHVEDEVDSPPALEVESILDFGRTVFPSNKLRWHYRSESDILIHFSNSHFYEGDLQMIPTAQINLAYHPPLTYIKVDGQWDHNRNKEEANNIIEILIHYLQAPDQPSIGIVTFNYQQQEFIKDLLEEYSLQLSETNDPLYPLLWDALNKHERDLSKGLFVKNIENVQGDERDIIIFSIGYAPDKKGMLAARFGLLNLKGGENRLNVAVTRAKKKIIVVSSFDPSELNVNQTTHDGPKLLKKYLNFVKAIHHHSIDDSLPISSALTSSKNEYDALRDISYVNMLNHLTNAITQKGYYVDRHIGHTSYRLDLAIKRHEHDTQYLLGIECEGPYYFSGLGPKGREVYRRDLFQQKGWTIYRIWARNYWQNKSGEIQKIIGLLKELSAG